MLELTGVTARLGDFTLVDVTLSVGKGETHVILGPSGSGKTMLLETVVGFHHLEAGMITLAGRNLSGVVPEGREIGYLPKRSTPLSHLSVGESIGCGAPAGTFPLRDRLVAATGIGPLLNRQTATLSDGEWQRVALVRTLAARPRLLLLDQPFAALNETLRRELWRLLQALQLELGFAVLLITNDFAEAFLLGSRSSVLVDGRIRQSAAMDTLWHRPATVEVANFLGISNLLAGTVTCRMEKAVEVDCPWLSERLIVAAPDPAPHLGAAVIVGIRPEFVALRDAAHPPGPGDLILTGKVTALAETGTEATLVFQPHWASGNSLEIRLGRRVLRKFCLATGQVITISLPPGDLFLIVP